MTCAHQDRYSCACWLGMPGPRYRETSYAWNYGLVAQDTNYILIWSARFLGDPRGPQLWGFDMLLSSESRGLLKSTCQLQLWWNNPPHKSCCQGISGLQCSARCSTDGRPCHLNRTTVPSWAWQDGNAPSPAGKLLLPALQEWNLTCDHSLPAEGLNPLPRCLWDFSMPQDFSTSEYSLFFFFHFFLSFFNASL